MLIRAIILLTFSVLFSNPCLAQQGDAPPKVGDHLVIQMTGDVAKEYARQVGWPVDPERKGYEVQTIATITQQLDDGRLRIELSHPIQTAGKVTRLVTLTATFDSAALTTHTTPKGTAVYSSPAAQKNGAQPTLTSEETKSHRLQISNLKGVKLRNWTLVEEIGE